MCSHCNSHSSYLSTAQPLLTWSSKQISCHIDILKQILSVGLKCLSVTLCIKNTSEGRHTATQAVVLVTCLHFLVKVKAGERCWTHWGKVLLLFLTLTDTHQNHKHMHVTSFYVDTWYTRIKQTPMHVYSHAYAHTHSEHADTMRYHTYMHTSLCVVHASKPPVSLSLHLSMDWRVP